MDYFLETAGRGGGGGGAWKFGLYSVRLRLFYVSALQRVPGRG